MIWIITTNSNLCRIYQYDKQEANITALKEINHPENRAKASEFLTTDKPGHYGADGTSGGAYSPHTDPKDVAVEQFSREITNELNKGRNEHAYQQLVIIASSHMQGLLAKHMDKHVKDFIIAEVQKDVMKLSEQELVHLLKELRLSTGVE